MNAPMKTTARTVSRLTLAVAALATPLLAAALAMARRR